MYSELYTKARSILLKIFFGVNKAYSSDTEVPFELKYLISPML